MRAQRGFSFVELLIAVAIILVIVAIAVPGLLRSHVAANETLALGAMRQIDVAQTAYNATYNNGYARELGQLGPSLVAGAKPNANAAAMLDPELGCHAQPCVRAGYGFAIESAGKNPNPTYRAIGLPLHPGVSGGRGFCDDQNHRLMYDPEGNANCKALAE